MSEQPYPSEPDWWRAVYEPAIRQAYADANHPLDWGTFMWYSRPGYSIGSGMTKEAAMDKHVAECRAALGLKPPTVVPPTGTLPELTIGGHFFRQGDKRFTGIQATDFEMLNLSQHGTDISSVLAQRRDCGFNMLRVWTAYDIETIGTFLDLNYEGIPAFVSLCAAYGLYVEFTAYTGINDPAHWTKLCDAARKCHPKPLLELVNELDQNTNEPDYLGRVFNLADYKKPSGLLASRGSNGAGKTPVRPWWDYEEYHTNDMNEWWRKGHNGMECTEGAQGSVPADEVIASHVPCLINENTRADKDGNAAHHYDAGMCCSFLPAGGCFHSVNGKLSRLWSGSELECAQAWATGARSVDIESQIGRYNRPWPPTAGYLITYQRLADDGRVWTIDIRK